MSLIDTIKGAREEAEQAGTLIGTKSEGTIKSGSSSDASTRTQGYARKTAANARPAREVAGSVHTAGSSSAKKSKEEKKVEREKRRSDEDLMYDTKRAVLDEMPEYRKSQKIWWGLLIAGLICTVIAWGAMRGLNQENAGESGIAAVTMVLMVLAYVLVIGAFVYDLVVVRKMRNAADDKVQGMTKKRMTKLVAEHEAQKAAKKGKK